MRALLRLAARRSETNRCARVGRSVWTPLANADVVRGCHFLDRNKVSFDMLSLSACSGCQVLSDTITVNNAVEFESISGHITHMWIMLTDSSC